MAIHSCSSLEQKPNNGRDNFAVKDAFVLQAAVDMLRDRPLYAEKWARFELELAVMVVKVDNDAAADW